MCGWPSSTVTIGAARARREQRRRGSASSPSARPWRACSARNSRSARGQADDVGGDAGAAELVGRGEHLGHDRAHRRRASPAGARRARAAGSRRRAPAGGGARARAGSAGTAASAWSTGRVRQPEVGRGAVRAARAGRGRASSVHSRSWPKAGSQATQPGCSRPIDGVMIDWWAPPSGASVTPDGRADEDRLAAGVDAERPRLERAVDERVVERADRQQRLAVARPGRAELAEQADQVGLGDAELDVLAVLGSRASARACRCRRRTSRCARRRTRRRRWLIQPPRLVEEATSGLTVTTRAADLGGVVGEVDEEAAERLLGRDASRCASRPSVGRDRRAARAAATGSRSQPRRGRARTARPRRVPGGERRPRVVGVGARARAASSLPSARRSAARSGSPGGPRSAAP